MTCSPDGSVASPWSRVTHERTRSIRRLASWCLGGYLITATTVLVLVLPGIVPLAIVLAATSWERGRRRADISRSAGGPGVRQR